MNINREINRQGKLDLIGECYGGPQDGTIVSRRGYADVWFPVMPDLKAFRWDGRPSDLDVLIPLYYYVYRWVSCERLEYMGVDD